MKALLPIVSFVGVVLLLPIGCSDSADNQSSDGGSDSSTTDSAVADSAVADHAVADSAIIDGGACMPNEHVVYVAPGCGTSAVPICVEAEDACGTHAFCGCDGVTFTGGCGAAQKPFASSGPCEDSALRDAGLDGD